MSGHPILGYLSSFATLQQQRNQPPHQRQHALGSGPLLSCELVYGPFLLGGLKFLFPLLLVNVFVWGTRLLVVRS